METPRQAVEAIIEAAKAGDWEGPELPDTVAAAIAHAEVVLRATLRVPVARRGLDLLLDLYPGAEVVIVMNQDPKAVALMAEAQNSEIFPLRIYPENGVWTCVDLMDRGRDELKRFAILNHTGNVYRVDEFGAVEDDPFIAVTPLSGRF